MSKTKIFIDAGHNPTGSWNTGATGNGMTEQDIVFDVAIELGRILEPHFDIRQSRPNPNTVLGTDNNSAINARWQAANTWGADYFISIHTNAGGGTGAETFISATKPQDRAFAVAVNDTYAAEMGLRNRGVKLDNAANAGSIGVLRNTRMPAILIELAFIDSPLANPDVEILRNRRIEMAQVIANGIFRFFNITEQPTPPIPQPEPQPEPSQPSHNLRYNTIIEMPDWAQPTVKKLVEKDFLQGDGVGLDLSLDMLRIFVVLDMAGNFN